MSAEGWRLTADKLFTAHRKPCNESCGKSGETTVEHISALIQPFFPFVDIKNFTA